MLNDTTDLSAVLGQAVNSFNRGDMATAASASRKVLERDPRDVGALEILGRVQFRADELEPAVATFERLLAVEPHHLQGLALLGAIRYRQERHDEALRLLETAIRYDQNFADAYNTLGAVLMAQGEMAEAESAMRTVLQLIPDKLDTLNNLGALLQINGRLEEAQSFLARALDLSPQMYNAYSNLATALLKSGRFEEALAVYGKGMAYHADNAEFRCNRANGLMLSGHLREGWLEYEWRRKLPEFAPWNRGYHQPLWQGEDLAGKTLLIHVEQGLGDIIQFSRYARLAAERGARVILEVYRPLLRLMAGLAGPAEVIVDGETPPPFDTYCPVLSLPVGFGTDIDTVPADIPYLTPPEGSAALWRERIGNAEGLKVGLVWAGSPHHKNNANRSLRFADYAPFLEIPGLRLFSLQKQFPAADAQLRLPPQVTDLAPFLGDMADTAGAIAELDLVVCVDTAVAHLAGALGKPVWVLLPIWPDWRWMLGRDDSPWYPSMRLFRQTAGRDWSEAIAATAAALAKLAEQHPA